VLEDIDSNCTRNYADACLLWKDSEGK
jgi:hypothetical protein